MHCGDDKNYVFDLICKSDLFWVLFIDYSLLEYRMPPATSYYIFPILFLILAPHSMTENVLRMPLTSQRDTGEIAEE